MSTKKMTNDAENPAVVSKEVTRSQQPDGSWSVTTSTVYADGTKKNVTLNLPDAQGAPAATAVDSPTKAQPPQSTRTVPMGNGAQLQVHPEASSAQCLGIVSIFIFGPILGPIAICKGVSAKNQIAANPDKFTGETQANVGIGCGTAGLLLWLILLIIVASQ